MKLSTFKYFVIDAFKSLRRNMTISLASIATVLATLFVFGVFLLTGLNINRGVQDVESKVEIKVFLVDKINAVDQKEIEAKLKSITGVKDVEYETKEQALESFRKQLKGYESILNGYSETNNPLPNSFIVKLQEPDVAENVQKEVKGMKGVEDIRNDQQLISTISSFTKAVRWIGLVLFVILVGVSLFLIVNTIRLAVYSRRREVGIMKFVGATDWFIRWPFIIEGVTIGIVGALISNIALYFSYKVVFTRISASLIMANLVSPIYVFTTMSWQFIIAGILIGVFGSLIALRKFLTV